MAYELPALPYAFDALEPHIDAQTMEIHHGKHHQAYVNNLNAALEKFPELQGKPRRGADQGTSTPSPRRFARAVRNNGGGHANHTLFWQIMGPNAGGAPTGAIADAITLDLRRLRHASRNSSTKPASAASAPAGRGWSSRAASSRSRARRTRTAR